MQPVARTHRPPAADDSHTYGLRSIFSGAHVTGENDLTLFRASERETLRGFFDTLKKETAEAVSFSCWRYLFSRSVSRQVSSAQVSLTSVFGMGTGGPSPQSTPTRVLAPSKLNKAPFVCLASCLHFILSTSVGQALGILVPVSCMHHCTSTSGLSTTSSTSCLTP